MVMVVLNRFRWSLVSIGEACSDLVSLQLDFSSSNLAVYRFGIWSLVQWSGKPALNQPNNNDHPRTTKDTVDVSVSGGGRERRISVGARSEEACKLLQPELLPG
ncbi:unnamed protein product [Arabis nemorensis]|uniref:Uncharacterized protein n=1 Tax=Arabis nemorensis TaxID=586526 RepID=A0A565CD88_9BRAS|nr:unnamed protein product [Arabis nemorensis]